MTETRTMPLPDSRILPEQEMLRRAREFRELAARRRTVRAFDSRPVACALIAIFAQKWGRAADGRRVKHYYPTESVGIATGILITALHTAGLATLTHTPSPMGFLNEILGRPADAERPFLLLVVGQPAEGARVPAIERRPLAVIASWV
jgi:nitroreductase